MEKVKSNNKDKMNNNRLSKKNLILIIIMILLLLIVGTYAWYSWRTNKTALVLTVGDINKVQVTLSPYQFNGSLNPTNAYTDNDYTQVTATNNQSIIRKISLFYKINSIDTALINSAFKYTVLKSTDGSSYSEYLEGNFSNASSESDFIIFDEEEIAANSTYYYRVYIWIDGSTDNTEMQGSVFNGELRASISYVDNTLNEADPVLTDGLIPVTIANDGTVTTASIYEKWYNYKNKEWANAILVKENGTRTRSYYQSNSGVTVSSNDILAYYVWIPRYKYQIWTIEESSAGKEQTINIVFEGKNATKSTGTAVGEYRTHPAFTFGSEELAGIWVGKFETSTDTSSTCYTSASSDNCDNASQEPRILPNVKSLRYQTISNQFQTSLKFSGGTLATDGTVTFAGSSTYGLSSTVDSHMMKNSEWGAVAYLSNSIYGINQKIYINNSSDYYTGRSGGNVGGMVATLAEQFPDSETSTNKYNAYGYYTWLGQEISSSGTIGTYASDKILGTKASTTGNITGVYDMSGGIREYVMGNYYGPESSTGFYNYPAEKYYDKYTTSTSTTACNGGICYGHALSETNNWYSDLTYFTDESYRWFQRGGFYGYGSAAGAFSFSCDTGGASSSYGFRAVLMAR